MAVVEAAVQPAAMGMPAAAAQLLGAHTVISEDMAHGRDYAGVTVINPSCRARSSSADSPDPALTSP